MPQTDKPFSVQHIPIFRVAADGKVIEHWANRDDLGAMAQFGLLSPPPASPSQPCMPVVVKRGGARPYNHPVVGEIVLDWDALTSDARTRPATRHPHTERRSRFEQALHKLAAGATEHIMPLTKQAGQGVSGGRPLPACRGS
jgi:hypothetical protein